MTVSVLRKSVLILNAIFDLGKFAGIIAAVMAISLLVIIFYYPKIKNPKKGSVPLVVENWMAHPLGV